MSNKAYAVLGVAPGATTAEIKAAYRERARKIHPDRFAGDPRRAQAAHDAFVELSAAFRSALAASADVVPASVPQQRRPAAPEAAVRKASVRQAAPVTVTPARENDPMLTLLTVPQRCGRPWSAQALETWALTVVPEARQHLTEAKRVARACKPSSERHLTTATAHALLTLTVNNLNGPRVMAVLSRLDDAYAALEIVLPRDLVDRLPARVTARRPSEDAAPADPTTSFLALFAFSGALAAAVAWTQLFGFFAG